MNGWKADNEWEVHNGREAHNSMRYTELYPLGPVEYESWVLPAAQNLEKGLIILDSICVILGEFPLEFGRRLRSFCVQHVELVVPHDNSGWNVVVLPELIPELEQLPEYALGFHLHVIGV